MPKRAPPIAILVLSACTSVAPPAGAASTPEPAVPARSEPPGSVDREPTTPTGGAAVGAAGDVQVAPARPAPADPVRALYVANCAQCHGETGDGQGTTKLDRKARSFLDGGFSYGNTKDAIVRSITFGIPGTPMPSFEKGLTPEQRSALADYVIALGPERAPVDPAAKEMVVRDRALVVRGKLPPIAAGGPEWPRGLAIGTPEGLSFEYRADDVRLVGVRAGAFVNRTDWEDRGGQPLEMLGQPVWTPEGAPDVAGFTLGRLRAGLPEPGARATARLLATAVEGTAAWVEYELRADLDGQPARVRVRENARAFRGDLGSGFVLRRECRTEDRGLYVGCCDLGAGAASVFSGACVCALVAGARPALVVARAPRAPSSVARSEGPRLLVELSPGKEQRIELLVLTDLPLFVTWDAALQERAVREFCR